MDHLFSAWIYSVIHNSCKESFFLYLRLILTVETSQLMYHNVIYELYQILNGICDGHKKRHNHINMDFFFLSFFFLTTVQGWCYCVLGSRMYSLIRGDQRWLPCNKPWQTCFANLMIKDPLFWQAEKSTHIFFYMNDCFLLSKSRTSF